MKALYDNMLAWGRPLFQTLHQIGGSKTSVNSIQKVLAKRTITPVNVDTVRLSDDKKFWIILLDSSYANLGDVIRHIGFNIEADVVGVDDDTGEIYVRKVFAGNVQVGDQIDVLYYTTPEVDALTNAVKVAIEGAAVKFTQDGGAETTVNQDTTNPQNSIGLPVAEVQKIIRDFAIVTFTALAPVTDAADLEIIASTNGAAKKILISETSGSPMYLQVDGGTNFIIPRGGIEIEHYIPAGSQIAVRSVDGNIEAGDIIINLIG